MQYIPEVQDSLSEIRQFAREDVKARPQIVSKHFPNNREWSQYSRSTQARLLATWRTRLVTRVQRTDGTSSLNESYAMETDTFQVFHPMSTISGEVREEKTNNEKPNSNSPTTHQEGGEGDTGSRQEEANPNTTQDAKTQANPIGSATRSIAQHFATKWNNNHRSGKKCNWRRSIRRVYDSIIIHGGITVGHIAFEAHFNPAIISEARKYWVATQYCGYCQSKARNHVGNVWYCYRCGEEETLETPSWLQVRNN